jgi:hypothetical protein
MPVKNSKTYLYRSIFDKEKRFIALMPLDNMKKERRRRDMSSPKNCIS